jgi:hypothetical protein
MGEPVIGGLVMCAVCFRGADPVAAWSLSAGILVLLGVTVTVLSGFAMLFVRLARGSHAAAHLVQPHDVARGESL